MFRFFMPVVILGLVACSGPVEEVPPPKVRPAKLVTVDASTNQRDLSFPAVIRAAQSAELTFQIAGEIRELNVLEGDQVERGMVIAQLDQRDARNRVAQSKAEFENAEAEYQRAERLAAQDAISRSVLDTRRTQRDVSRASLSTAQKGLSDTVLRAPFDGFISRVNGRQFQNVQAKEAIAMLQSDEVEAIINVPGTIIARMPQLEPVKVRVILDAAPEAEILATFKEAAGEADAATQTYEISFSFVPPDDLFILPGMTATVQSSFMFSGAEDIVARGVAAPITAILSEADRKYVWLVDPDTMRLEKRQVEISGDGATHVTVTSGLSGGETIVAAGVSFFSEGMTVRPWAQD